MADYNVIAETIRLDEVLNALGVHVERIRNGNHWGDCPIHADDNAHFSINEDTLLWNCYVCNEGGRLPKLIIRVLELEDDQFDSAWQKAVEWLIPFSDGELADDSDNEEHAKRMDRIWNKVETKVTRTRGEQMPVYSERVLGDLEEVPLELLDKWNIFHQATMHAFRVGLDPERKRGDYVGPAIVIPHFFKGSLVGYQERWLAPEDERPRYVPKYTNSDDFPKKSTLYNWDRASKAGDYVIVVESAMSVIRLWELGYDAVATFGASVSAPQIRMLRSFDKGVYLSYDNDSAGKKAIKDLTDKLAGEIPVRVLPLPENHNGDIADYADEEVVALMRAAKQVFANTNE